MKILVTGGCGLIGYNTCVYYKQRGHDVVSVDNLERSSLLGHEVSEDRAFFNKRELQRIGVDTWLHDVSRKDFWTTYPTFDAVIHLAGQCGVPTSIANPRRDFEVNTIGTLNALEYCRRTNAALVLASTNKVYPIHDDPASPTWTKRGGLWQFTDLRFIDGVRESVPFTGARTPYGNSKMAADLLCQEWSHTYGIRTGVFRMSCIYGPNQFGFEEQGWATWFVIAALKGWPITIYGDGDQTRDMLYVTDAVRAYDAFLTSNVKHGIWNLGGGPNQVVSLKQMLDSLEVMTGKRSPVNFADWRPLDQKCYVSDISKIVADLKWAPEIKPAAGIRNTLEWVEKNLGIF